MLEICASNVAIISSIYCINTIDTELCLAQCGEVWVHKHSEILELDVDTQSCRFESSNSEPTPISSKFCN